MARPIPYPSDLTTWASVGTGRQVLRGLIVGLILSVLISAGVWMLSTSVESKMFSNESMLAKI
jgi:hypothetical protein